MDKNPCICCMGVPTNYRRNCEHCTACLLGLTGGIAGELLRYTTCQVVLGVATVSQRRASKRSRRCEVMLLFIERKHAVQSAVDSAIYAKLHTVEVQHFIRTSSSTTEHAMLARGSGAMPLQSRMTTQQTKPQNRGISLSMCTCCD